MQCDKCSKIFSTPQALSRHRRESCSLRFVNVTKRESSDVSETSKRIKLSKKNDTSSSTKKPLNCKRLNVDSVPLGEGVEKISSAFKCRISTYRFSAMNHFIIHNDFFESIKVKVLTVLTQHLAVFITLKVNFELFSLYTKPESELSDTKSFNTKNRVITEADQLGDVFQEFQAEIMAKSENFQEKDSGMFYSSLLLITIP